MNGKRAKRLRKLAERILQTENIGWGEGYRKYHQAKNRNSLEPAMGKAGKQMKDPDGVPLVTVVKRPGTYYTAWRFRQVYQKLKMLWKKTGGNHVLFEDEFYANYKPSTKITKTSD